MTRTHTGGVEMWLYMFLTLVLDGSEWLILCPGCFTPGKKPVPTEYEVGWTPKLVCMFWGREKSCPPGIHILDRLARNLFATMTVLLQHQ